MPTININSIETNSKVYVTGIVDYSRIASQLDGEELAADNAKKVARGMRAVDKPHTRLSLSNCVVDYENPAEPTLAERFIAEKLYKSKTHPEKGDCYTAVNKSRNLPSLFCRENAQSKKIELVAATGELMTGVPVTIMLRFFSTKQNSGVSLDSVIVNEKPIRWYSGNSTQNILAERGFEIVNPSAASAVPTVDEVRAQLNANAAQPAPAPVPAPTAAPYMQPAPVAEAPAPAPAPNPAPSLPIPPAGYTYDENGRIVPIANAAPSGGIKL